MNILRLGSPARVQSWLLESTLSYKVSLHPKGREAITPENVSRHHVFRSRQSEKQAQQLDREAAIQVINTSDVISTCVGAGDDLLADSSFATLLLTKPH